MSSAPTILQTTGDAIRATLGPITCVATMLGIFPGPGLGVRILGEVTKQYADLLSAADAAFIEELRNHELYDRTSQASQCFCPYVRSQ